MLKQLAYAGLIGAALAAPPVFAQTNNTSPAPSAPAAQTDKSDATKPDAMKPDAAAKSDTMKSDAAAKPDTTKSDTNAAANASDQNFVTEQAMNQWRASKLVGVKIYGPDQKKVGSIKDILMDHDGNAQVIVMGVGGFLGIGAKDVAVPFKSMQWRTEGRAVASNPPASSTSGTSGTGMTSTPATTKTDPAATEANQGYPDMGIINMTEAQLKAAPDFHYAPSPDSNATATNTAPAAGGAVNSEPPKKP
ncbi:MAG TPA: PRC-barrel domain-containing protein [Roseiarcus sp.]|nr:PRC-barrel domain-containing protein [Roseiarcus sp.]